MGTFQALGISVFAGFLVVVLLGVSRLLWWWALENVYLKVTCRHQTDVSGKWIAEYQDSSGHSCYEESELKQYG
ncbi:MAG: hypothetical protein V2A58_12675 [Planctomycetota bacterium]